ncbi:hypothetical protein PR202_ga10334 [Eleusine coracana subsp. coracana]|uniref:Uncharacterized protein n=1 Tax=Eleusine coracana subsp. coracana TaxID=191504 RepID=A0AAV5C6E5_ELECO|nr:hypothetical protein PR202_ga10334 [Eleusine coracana subsp. coracana]
MSHRLRQQNQEKYSFQPLHTKIRKRLNPLLAGEGGGRSRCGSSRPSAALKTSVVRAGRAVGDLGNYIPSCSRCPWRRNWTDAHLTALTLRDGRAFGIPMPACNPKIAPPALSSAHLTVADHGGGARRSRRPSSRRPRLHDPHTASSAPPSCAASSSHRPSPSSSPPSSTSHCRTSSPPLHPALGLGFSRRRGARSSIIISPTGPATERRACLLAASGRHHLFASGSWCSASRATVDR